MNSGEAPWRQRGAHGDLILEMRTLRTSVKDKTKGSITEEIRVRYSAGRILLDKEVTLNWTHFGQINAAFSDDGLSVVVTTSDGRDRVWPLAALIPPKDSKG